MEAQWKEKPNDEGHSGKKHSKTLVTAGTIKRPLPCPVEGVEKQSIFYNVKRKNRARGKEKR